MFKNIDSSLLLLLGLLAACGGTTRPPNEGARALGRDPITRAELLVTLSMLYAGTICGDPEVRGCLLVSDFECVRVIGDAVLVSDQANLEMMSGEEQVRWADERGGPAAKRAGATLPMRTPCTDTKTTPALGGISVRRESGARCVRRDGDETPCAP